MQVSEVDRDQVSKQFATLLKLFTWKPCFQSLVMTLYPSYVEINGKGEIPYVIGEPCRELLEFIGIVIHQPVIPCLIDEAKFVSDRKLVYGEKKTQSCVEFPNSIQAQDSSRDHDNLYTETDIKDI